MPCMPPRQSPSNTLAAANAKGRNSRLLARGNTCPYGHATSTGQARFIQPRICVGFASDLHTKMLMLQCHTHTTSIMVISTRTV